MLDLLQKVKVKWHVKNREWYREIGYTFSKLGDEFEVSLKDLSVGSSSEVMIICDYCGEPFNNVYKTYIFKKRRSTSNKDCCNDCIGLKVSETWGQKSKEEIEKINKKTKDTLLDRYGVDNLMKSKEFKDKRNSTNLIKYGTINPMSNKDVFNKYEQTMIKLYGVKYNGLREDIKKSLNEKRVKTLYEKGSAPTSKEQRYLHGLFGGELNYPIGTISMDIAFLEDKIYVEYDGSGHDLQVQYGRIDARNFKFIETKRYYFLKSQGWKQIQIISKLDRLPSEKLLLFLISYCKSNLKYKNNNWIKIDLDNSNIITKDSESKIDLGNMKKLKNKKQSVF